MAWPGRPGFCPKMLKTRVLQKVLLLSKKVFVTRVLQIFCKSVLYMWLPLVDFGLATLVFANVGLQLIGLHLWSKLALPHLSSRMWAVALCFFPLFLFVYFRSRLLSFFSFRLALCFSLIPPFLFLTFLLLYFLFLSLSLSFSFCLFRLFFFLVFSLAFSLSFSLLSLFFLLFFLVSSFSLISLSSPSYFFSFLRLQSLFLSFSFFFL